jgi:hypothetical protein
MTDRINVTLTWANGHTHTITIDGRLVHPADDDSEYEAPMYLWTTTHAVDRLERVDVEINKGGGDG